MEKQVYFSKACGKVLVCGGYGVLQQSNIGLSLALENYFFCRLQIADPNAETQFIVESPQISKSYDYRINQSQQRLIEAKQQENIFVENALKYTWQHFGKPLKSGKLKLTLFFDRGFISEKNELKADSGKRFPNYDQKYSKTGLGSSACVVVSIVSTLCNFFSEKPVGKQFVNVVSQVANLAAQKKIGSNFDISTAVYGSHLYKNVLPCKAYEFIDKEDLSPLLGILPEISDIYNVNQSLKDETVSFMIDVEEGANTRTMVGNFLKNLRMQSQQIQANFFKQSKSITAKLYEAFKKISMANKSDLESATEMLKQINQQHRRLQQEYSKLTETPVEPEQLTEFLDRMSKHKDVLYVICPGSGGLDALFLLGLKRPDYQSYFSSLVENILMSCDSYERGQIRRIGLKEVSIKWNGQSDVTEEEKLQLASYYD